MDDQAKYTDPEEMVSCPYDAAHRVLEKRLHIHFQKNHPLEQMKGFKTCPFNFKHRIPCREYENHLENCSNRTVDNNNDPENDRMAALYENVTKPLDIPEYEENWDEANDSNILDEIQTGAKQGQFLQNHSNEPSSVRKAKRNEPGEQNRKSKVKQKNAVSPERASTSVVNQNSIERNDSKLGSSYDDDLESTGSWKTAGTATTQQADISYGTVLNSTTERLGKFQLEDKKKVGRGRSKIAQNTGVKAGIGRGRRLQSETELPKQNPPNEFQE